MRKNYLVLLLLFTTTILLGQDCSDPGTTPGNLGCVTFTYKGNPITYTTVRGRDGKIWLQQNLGSETVASSATDAASFGDLFQWGRWDDGHQIRSSTTSSIALEPNNPLGLNGGMSEFLTNDADWWISGTQTDRWEAPTPANATSENGCDPCKALGEGWTMPTQEDWTQAIASENITNIATAYDSSLKLSVGGTRTSSGGFNFVGQRGYYWSKTTSSSGNYAKYFYYSNAVVNAGAGSFREQGSSVRCLKTSGSLGVGEIIKTNFKLYPNPTSGIVNIQTDLEIKTVSIYNHLGQLVSTQDNAQIDLANLSTGIYMIRVDFENGQTANQKVIKK
jgi:uncharacterized protein (TIGR02145 family)